MTWRTRLRAPCLRLFSTLRRAVTQRSEPERRQEWRRGTQSACATSLPKSLATFWRKIRGSNRSPEKHARRPAIFARHSPPARFSSLLVGRRPIRHSPEKHARSHTAFARPSPLGVFFITIGGPQAHVDSLRSRLCKWLKIGSADSEPRPQGAVSAHFAPESS